jgi:hypothetical protein
MLKEGHVLEEEGHLLENFLEEGIALEEEGHLLKEGNAEEEGHLLEEGNALEEGHVLYEVEHVLGEGERVLEEGEHALEGEYVLREEVYEEGHNQLNCLRHYPQKNQDFQQSQHRP